jgi:hypothetical protein
MEKESILSYELVDLCDIDNTKYYFHNLTSMPNGCKNPEECKITCLTYRRNNDTEKVKQGLQNEILDLGYRTKDEFESSLRESQEKIHSNELKSWLNPLDKNKSRNEKIGAGGMIAMHVAPFVLIPASFFVGNPASTLLVGAGGALAVSDIAVGFARRGDVSGEKRNIRKLEEKFKDPNREYFCKLKEIAPKISVENVLVDDAHLLFENMKANNFVKLKHWWGETKKEIDYSSVNAELNKIYEDYISQPKT